MPAHRRRAPQNAAPEVALTWTGDSPDAWLVREYTLALRAGVRPGVRSEQTVRTYAAALRSLTSFLAEQRFPSLVAAERQHIQAGVIALRERRKPATVQLYLTAAVRLRTRHPYAELPWLWLAQSRGQLAPSVIAALHSTLGERLGFHIHPHRWRHTFAQALLDDGMDRESVRLLMGHESLETLRIYTAARDRQRALDAHKAHSPADRLTRRPWR